MISTYFHRLAEWSRPWLAQTPKYANSGAWFFAIGSMLPLLWLMIEGRGADGAARVFGTSVDGQQYSVWGLTYSGAPGSILMWLEFLALVGATVATALPDRLALRDGALRLRRIGHGFLVSWAALWMLGAMRLASVDPGFWTLQAAFLTTLFGCTAYRAWSQWSPNNPNAGRSDAVPVEVKRDRTPSSHVEGAASFDEPLHRSAVRPTARLEELDPFQASRWRSHNLPLRLTADEDEGPGSGPADLRFAGARRRAANLRSMGVAARNRARPIWSFMRVKGKQLGTIVRSTFADITRTSQSELPHQGK